MRKSLSAILISLLAVSYATDITPTISLRVNDLLASELAFATPAVIGLQISGFDDGVVTGFDTDAVGSRVYIARSYGKVGLGTYTAGGAGVIGKPFFTIGTSFNAYANLNVELEYVMNNLATSNDALQMSLTITF